MNCAKLFYLSRKLKIAMECENGNVQLKKMGWKFDDGIHLRHETCNWNYEDGIQLKKYANGIMTMEFT